MDAAAAPTCKNRRLETSYCFGSTSKGSDLPMLPSPFRELTHYVSMPNRIQARCEGDA